LIYNIKTQVKFDLGIWGSPTADPELSYVYKQGEIISKCVIKKLQKYKNLFLILVTGKLFTNV